MKSLIFLKVCPAFRLLPLSPTAPLRWGFTWSPSQSQTPPLLTPPPHRLSEYSRCLLLLTCLMLPSSHWERVSAPILFIWDSAPPWTKTDLRVFLHLTVFLCLLAWCCSVLTLLLPGDEPLLHSHVWPKWAWPQVLCAETARPLQRSDILARQERRLGPRLQAATHITAGHTRVAYCDGWSFNRLKIEGSECAGTTARVLLIFHLNLMWIPLRFKTDKTFFKAIK